jgi:polyhydroxyalkanoate synthesis regulator phasin
VGDGLGSLAEQLAGRVMKPLGLVVLSRERIEEVLTDAAERGRITRSDANDLVTELVRRGRTETELLLGELERLLGRGRQQLDVARKLARRSDSVERLVRGASRARRVGAGSRFPISGYDKLTVAQVKRQLGGLSKAELRQVREYELRHANRRSVLSAIDSSTG